MADWLGSAFVQEAVNRGVSFVLGKREEKASQGHLMERLEMAVSQLEFALERTQELRIRHLSLISSRKRIKSAYLEAMELLDKHKQHQEVPAGQELQVDQGVKRKRGLFWAKNMAITSSFAGLSDDDVRTFERYADYAGKFVGNVVSGCSLHHNTFCNPIVRHLLEGKTLQYYFVEQGKLLRRFVIWPVYSEERGMEAVLGYQYEDSRMAEKCFFLMLVLRISDSMDIVGVAVKCLQLLTSAFKLAAECAMGELTTLLSNLQGIAHSYRPPWVDDVNLQDLHMEQTQIARPDPACCKGSRHGLCANNNSSSDLSHIFPEQVIFFIFNCYCVPALESSTHSSFEEVCRGWKPPLEVIIHIRPHTFFIEPLVMCLSDYLLKKGTLESCNFICAIERIGRDLGKFINNVSIEEVAETIKSNAINCLSRQPELRDYRIDWGSVHGHALFVVENTSVETAGVARTRKRYNTRSSKNKWK